MFELTIEIPFSAAHQICGHAGPCARLHGHNYRAVVVVAGEGLNDLGMLVDFGDLKKLCADVIAPLDHSFLNELPAFSSTNPTAEALARHIYQGVNARLAGAGTFTLSEAEGPALCPARVSRVTVYESERSSATYREQ